jgi:hypothetical protein
MKAKFSNSQIFTLLILKQLLLRKMGMMGFESLAAAGSRAIIYGGGGGGGVVH